MLKNLQQKRNQRKRLKNKNKQSKRAAFLLSANTQPNRY